MFVYNGVVKLVMIHSFFFFPRAAKTALKLKSVYASSREVITWHSALHSNRG